MQKSLENSKPKVSTTTPPPATPAPKEIGGRKNGLDPTRYDDWEKDGRAIDF